MGRAAGDPRVVSQGIWGSITGAAEPPARRHGGGRTLLTCSTLVMATSASICRALRSRVRS